MGVSLLAACGASVAAPDGGPVSEGDVPPPPPPPGFSSHGEPSQTDRTYPPSFDPPPGPEPLPTRLVIENQSGATIVTESSCGAPSFFATPHPEAPWDGRATDEIEAVERELGCICECGSVPFNRACNATDCRSWVVTCLPASDRAELAHGKAVKRVVSPTRLAYVDPGRMCVGRSGYERGYPFVARYCWYREGHVRPRDMRCEELPYEYGAEEVRLIVQPPGSGAGETVTAAHTGDRADADAGSDDDAGS